MVASPQGPPSAAATGGTGGPGRAGRPQGRRILGLPVPVVIGAGAGLVALGIIWWRNRTKTTGVATSATRTSSTSSTDTEGALEELQAELDQLSGAFNASQQGGTATTTKTTATAKTTKTTAPAPGKPGPVSDLTVTNKSPTSVTVSWRPPQFASKAPTATTYKIQIKPKDPAAHVIGSRTSYNVGGLHKNTHYTAVVSAVGGPSTSHAFTTEK